MNGLLQFAHVSEGSAPNASLRDLGKEALHLIEPTRTCGSKVQVITRMPDKPALHLGRLVRPIVIHHDVHGRSRGQLAIDHFQELEKLLRAMALALARLFCWWQPPGPRTT